MEEEAKVWKDEVKAIEERVALRRKANAEQNQLLARDQQENQSSFNRVHPEEVDSLRPGSMIGFDASPNRRPAQALRGRRSFADINDTLRLDYRSFGARCDAAGLGVECGQQSRAHFWRSAKYSGELRKDVSNWYA
jgi:hypothetical protein